LGDPWLPQAMPGRHRATSSDTGPHGAPASPEAASPLPGDPRSRRWAAAIGLVALIGAMTFYRVADPPLTGDEPHYMVYARSLAEGWGLDLARAFQPENYEPFYGGELGPHGRRYTGPDGPLATWHAIGLPLLVAPALLVDVSVWAGRWVMLLIYAALVYHVFRLTSTLLGGRVAVAAVAVLLVVLAPPLIVYSGQIFPEIAAALLVVIALRALLSRQPAWIRVGGASTAASLLPWLNVRFLTLTGVLILIAMVVAARHAQPARSMAPLVAALALPAAVFGGLLIAFNLELYGRLAPALEVVERGSYFQPENLYTWGLGGLVGPRGIAPHAPVLLVALVAVPTAAMLMGAWRVVAGSIVFAVYAGINAFFGSPGYAPPGRYFVSVLPLLAVPLAAGFLVGGRFVRSVAVVLGGLTALSIITTALHFPALYTSAMDGIQPGMAMEPLVPFVLEEQRATGVSTDAGQIAHQVGTLRHVDGSIMLVARSPGDPAGALAYGPYTTLVPGRYVARFDLWSPRSIAPSTTGALDVVAVDGGTLARRSIEGLSPGHTTIRLPFVTDGEARLEIRVFFGAGVLGVRSIEATMVEPLGTRDVAGEAWKMLAWIALLILLAVVWYVRERARRLPVGKDRSTGAHPESRTLA
jgi:hypothetical protein